MEAIFAQTMMDGDACVWMFYWLHCLSDQPGVVFPLAVKSWEVG